MARGRRKEKQRGEKKRIANGLIFLAPQGKKTFNESKEIVIGKLSQILIYFLLYFNYFWGDANTA